MAKTESIMVELGTQAPAFQVVDVTSGTTTTLAAFNNKKVLLVMFLCVHCPYVKHVKSELAKIGRDYQGKDVGIVAISSNDVTLYVDDSPDSMRKMAQDEGFTFPFCFDESQEAAKAFKAACTPDFFLYDSQQKLVYRGQLDDSRPGNNLPTTGKDLRSAIDAVLSGQQVTNDQKPSMGCSIKWKNGNEPEYV